MVNQEKGCLYLCATPIGNLEDITLRALNVLREGDVIAAEDTRHTRKLLSHYDIHKPLTSYHEHNKAQKGQQLLRMMLSGQKVVLVSDAGMPGISDPGYHLVKACIHAGIPVVAIPGASAAVTALVISGLNTDRFVFEGFLPRSGKERKKRVQELIQEKRTMVFYEAPQRLLATLEELLATLGNRPAAVVRELTKKYEQVVRGDLEELVAHFTSTPPRGEITLVVAGKPFSENIRTHSAHDAAQQVLRMVQYGMNKKEAIKMVASQAGLAKREVYAAVLALEKE